MENRIKACVYLRVSTRKQTRNAEACIYVRASTKEQAENAEASLEAQRKRLLDLAAGDDISIQTQRERLHDLAERENFEIIAEYVDDGYSGADPTRPGWCKLLSDAPTAEWVVVLSLNRTRFSRLNGVEYAMAVQTLRDAKKKLHTAVEGLFDWATPVGRIIDAMIDAEEGVPEPIVVEGGEKLHTTMEQPAEPTDSVGRIASMIRDEESQQHSAQHARRSLEGKLRAFQEGRSVVGVARYGYAFLVTDPQGHTNRISRLENFSVPKGWSKTPVPGDPEEIKVVQWIFETYASTDRTIRSLEEELDAKGVPSPLGGKWRASTIVELLANDGYVGDTRFGRRSSGKFFRVEGDKVVKVEGDTTDKQQGGLVRKDTHEGIISREVWDRVQEKLNRRE